MEQSTTDYDAYMTRFDPPTYAQIVKWIVGGQRVQEGEGAEETLATMGDILSAHRDNMLGYLQERDVIEGAIPTYVLPFNYMLSKLDVENMDDRMTRAELGEFMEAVQDKISYDLLAFALDTLVQRAVTKGDADELRNL